MKKKIILIAVILLLVIVIATVAYAFLRCPTCGSMMHKVFRSKYQGGHHYELYECWNGHEWWIADD